MDTPLAASRLPILCGPTAGGKTAASIALAHAYSKLTSRPAEIISADAFLIYQHMNIGTAKPSLQERQGIPHHLIDIISPTETFSVEQWLTAADKAIHDIRARGALPIVVGGTHLYIQALLYGLFQGPPADPDFRAELNTWPIEKLRAELEKVDPAAALKLHRNDTRRSIRALEVFKATGQTISSLQQQWELTATPRPGSLLITLDWEPEPLNRRINARVRQMEADGLTAEVEELLAKNLLGPTAREALGYKQIAAALQHPSGPAGQAYRVEEAYEETKIQTRRFAKNQRTWLKRLRQTPESVGWSCPPTDPQELTQTLVRQRLM
jgi:tRNA dimethylallyltransferase